MAIAKIKADALDYDLKSSAPAGAEGQVYYNSTSKKMQIYVSSWQGLGAEAFSVTAKSADYSILSSDCGGQKGFSATSTLKFTLPSASAGLKVTLLNNTGSYMQIDTGSGDYIIFNKLEYPSLASIIKGEVFELTAIDSTYWVCKTNKTETASAKFITSNSNIILP